MAYRDVAVLPKGLETQMRMFQLAPISFGTATLIMGAVSMAVFELNLYMPFVTAAAATILTGFLGLYASWKRNLAFHTATLGVAILATWLGITAYGISLNVTTAAPIDNSYEALILADLLVVLLNLIVTTMVIGLQAIVIYISSTMPSYAVALQGPPQHQQPEYQQPQHHQPQHHQPQHHQPQEYQVRELRGGNYEIPHITMSR